MKTKSILILTLLLLCMVTVVANATDRSDFSVLVEDINTFVVQLNKQGQRNVDLVLKDEKGITLYNKTVQQNNSIKQRFDLNKLPTGIYTLVVTYDKESKVQPIKKGYGILEIETEELHTIFHPTILQGPGYVDLNMICFADVNIFVEIANEEMDVIFRYEVEANGAINQRFNLTQLKEGEYSFIVKLEDECISKEFKEMIEVATPIYASL